MSKIVITGAGIVSAIGMGKQASLEALLGLRSGIGRMRYLSSSHTELPVGEVKWSNAEMQQMVEVPADEGRPLSRTALMGRIALREALEEAGLLTVAGIDAEALAQMPLISGTTVAGMDRAELSFADPDPEGIRRDLLASESDCGSNTAEIARGFGRFASLDTISTACSSAANACILGANLIRSGQCERVVVGGTESLSRLHLNGFNTLMILDHSPCRPFDATRAGLNLGEGAAFLVMESEAAALRRGARPLAELAGYANACDAFHQTASSADGEGAWLAMSGAVRMAGLKPSDIDYVNAHGTGTPNNDPSELTAMHRLFDTLPPFSSTKGFTGHTTSASGSIEAVFCLLALRHQFLPVSLNWEQPIEGEASPVVAGEQLSRPLRHILCNAFGFGGNDSSLLLSAYEPTGEALPPAAASPMRICVLAHRVLPDADPDFKQYMTAGEARRLGRMLKRTLAVSVQTMQEGGIAQPDAIITGTQWGSMESSELFLRDMLEHGEEMLKPTNFMQSTHNTMSSLIAIATGNHGYNSTHSQGAESLVCAMRDALTLMQLGRIRSALVGLHDSMPEMHNEALLLCVPDAVPEGHTPIDEIRIG